MQWADYIIDEKGESDKQIVTEEENISRDYCYAFKVHKPEIKWFSIFNGIMHLTGFVF